MNHSGVLYYKRVSILCHLQVDLAHLLAVRDQELRTLSAEVILLLISGTC